MTNNGKQFDNERYKKMWSKLGIKCYFFSPIDQQANGQVKAVNKVIKYHLKTQLNNHKGVWANELLGML